MQQTPDISCQDYKQLSRITFGGICDAEGLDLVSLQTPVTQTSVGQALVLLDTADSPQPYKMHVRQESSKISPVRYIRPILAQDP